MQNAEQIEAILAKPAFRLSKDNLMHFGSFKTCMQNAEQIENILAGAAFGRKKSMPLDIRSFFSGKLAAAAAQIPKEKRPRSEDELEQRYATMSKTNLPQKGPQQATSSNPSRG
nr:hypothetical protein B0A51_06182 [Rachicladosporium sp. CCFEE 5018]